MNSEKASIENANTALVTLSDDGAALVERLCSIFCSSSIFLHSNVSHGIPGSRFDHLLDVSQQIFSGFRSIVFIGPTGVAVRAFGPLAAHKTIDPAIVVVDVFGRHAISLLSGHEGGANELALLVANHLGAEPVITTTTEARKDLIVGVGCKKGSQSSTIVEAIKNTLDDEGLDLSRVRFIASADVKKSEAGLVEASRILDIPLRFVSSEEIRRKHYVFDLSEFVYSHFGLPGVAEPSAILAGRRTELISRKRKWNGVTVAIAKENST